MNEQVPMDTVTSEESSKSAAQGGIYPLERIRDICPETPWPPHVMSLICGKGWNDHSDNKSNEDLTMKLDEVTACICHVALVEIGFIPTYFEVEPTDVRFMDDKERIVSFSTGLPPNSRNSSVGILNVSYRAIRENSKSISQEANNVGKNVTAEGVAITNNFLQSRPSSAIVSNDNPPNVNVEQAEAETEDNQSESEPLYEFTDPVDVIMMVQNGTLSLYGHVRFESSITSRNSSDTKTVHLDINIRDFLPPHCSIRNFDVNAILTGQQWLKQVQLDGSSLSDQLKVKFGKVLLTLVDGIFFEPSLQHLAPETLLRIFSYLPIKNVCRLTQVSHYMYAVADNDLFWLSLIDRDFPAEAPEIHSRFPHYTVATPISSSSNVATTSSANKPFVPASVSTPHISFGPAMTSTSSRIQEAASMYIEYVRLYQKHHRSIFRQIRPSRRYFMDPRRRAFTPLLGFHPPQFRFW